MHACEHPVRDLTIGGAGGGALALANLVAPALMDQVTALIGKPTRTTDGPGDPARRGKLCEPREVPAENTAPKPSIRKTSPALRAQPRPETAALVAGIALAASAALLRPRRRRGA